MYPNEWTVTTMTPIFKVKVKVTDLAWDYPGV